MGPSVPKAALTSSYEGKRKEDGRRRGDARPRPRPFDRREFYPHIRHPGLQVKPGLANIVILLLIYQFSWKEALIVDLGRIFLASLMTGRILSFPFYMSLAGGVLSYLAMLLVKGAFSKVFTIYGASLLGAFFHSLGQILVAIPLLGTSAVLWYFPLMGLTSLLTGLATGFLADRIIKTRVFEFLRITKR